MYQYKENQTALHCLKHSISFLHSLHHLNHYSSYVDSKNLVMYSLQRRCNLNLASNVCEAAPRTVLWTPDGVNKLPKVCLEFPFNLIGQSNNGFLTGQPRCDFSTGSQTELTRAIVLSGVLDSFSKVSFRSQTMPGLLPDWSLFKRSLIRIF